ncbi:MAG: DUF2393 family protein [Campylobacterales bacterium]|nr:DUF2393 family protein [Campylobacterales bacterium]
METPKHPLAIYISHFQMGDYIAFAWLVLLFFLFIFLAIVLAKKRPLGAIVIVLLDLMLLFGAPFAMKHYLDAALRSASVELLVVKQLLFTDTLLVQGTLHNTAPKDFAWCRVTLTITPKKEGTLLRYVSAFKPLHQESIFIQTPPARGEIVDFKTMIEPFRLDDTMEIMAKAECY